MDELHEGLTHFEDLAQPAQLDREASCGRMTTEVRVNGESRFMQHTDAFIRAFVRSERRARYRLDAEFPLERVYHHLEYDLDPRFMLQLPPGLQSSHGIVGLVRRLSVCEEGHVVAAGGMCPESWTPGSTIHLDELAVDDVWYNEDVVMSFEAGKLAYFAPEAYTKNRRYLLVTQPSRRQQAVEMFNESTSQKDPRRRRERRGSRK